MLKKNKKSLLVGACALAGVAVTSVGFATWVFGVENRNAQTEYKVLVDNVENDTVYLTIGKIADAKINIGESVAYSKAGDDIVGTKAGEGTTLVANAMEFKIPDIQIKIGKSVATKPTTLSINLLADDNTFNKVTLEKEDYFKRSAGDYNYVKYTRDITLDFTSGDSANMKEEGSTESYYNYKFVGSKAGSTDFVDTLKWGTFFGNADDKTNNSPVTYYNSREIITSTMNDEAKFNAKLEASSKAYEEVSAMHKALDDKTFTFKISLK